MATEIVIETPGGSVIIPSDSTLANRARNVIVDPPVAGTTSVQEALELIAATGGGGGGGGGAPTNAQYIVRQTAAGLTDERVITAGTNIQITDGGPKGNLTIASTVTKATIGLGNVDNTSDLDKPVSTATQTALDGKANDSHTHVVADVTDFATAVAAAPVGTATQTALDAITAQLGQVDLSGISDGSLLAKTSDSNGDGFAAAVAGTDYVQPSAVDHLTTFFVDGDLPTAAPTTTGFLRYAYDTNQETGSWSLEAGTVEAPPVINGGDANADASQP